MFSQGAKDLPRASCTFRNLFCTSATLFCTSARGLSLPGSKRPFAPSRNHFREFPIFDPLSQAAWLATLGDTLTGYKAVAPQCSYAPDGDACGRFASHCKPLISVSTCQPELRTLVQVSGYVRPLQRTEICNFRAPSPLFCFLIFSTGYFSLFSRLSVEHCNLDWKHPHVWRKLPDFWVGEKCVKSCHVPGCHAFFQSQKCAVIARSLGICDCDCGL